MKSILYIFLKISLVMVIIFILSVMTCGVYAYSYNEDGYSKVYRKSFYINGGQREQNFKEFKQAADCFNKSGVMYNSGNYQSKGCGPTSIAIIFSGLVGFDNINPLDVGPIMRRTNKSRVISTVNTIGEGVITARDIGKSKDNIIRELNDRNLIIISTKNSFFTEGSHLMALLNIDRFEKEVYVSNPGTIDSRKNGWMDIDFVLEDLYYAVLVDVTYGRPMLTRTIGKNTQLAQINSINTGITLKNN